MDGNFENAIFDMFCKEVYPNHNFDLYSCTL